MRTHISFTFLYISPSYSRVTAGCVLVFGWFLQEWWFLRRPSDPQGLTQKSRNENKGNSRNSQTITQSVSGRLKRVKAEYAHALTSISLWKKLNLANTDLIYTTFKTHFWLEVMRHLGSLNKIRNKNLSMPRHSFKNHVIKTECIKHYSNWKAI